MGKAKLIIGDSHALNLFNAFASRAIPNKEFIIGLSAGGCRVTNERPDCRELFAYAEKVASRGSVEHIIYHQSGHHLLVDGHGDAGVNHIFEEDQKPFSYNENDLKLITEALENLAKNTRLSFIGPHSEPRIELDLFTESFEMICIFLLVVRCFFLLCSRS